MQIRSANINEKERWNEFIRTQAMGSFLQSWEWSEFLEKQKEKVWRLVVEDEGEWLATVSLFKTKLKGGFSVLEAPRGPVVNEIRNSNIEIRTNTKLEIINSKIIEKVGEIAKEENALLFQIEPMTNEKEWSDLLIKQGFKESAVDSSPSHTLILDITKSEDELMAQMHQKTRYNIRLAQKKGVTISIDNGKAKEFYALMKKTMQRQGFNYYGEKYYTEMMKVPFVKLYCAHYQGKVIAANIMVLWSETATYLFGASDYEFRDVMAPHLLQWTAICDAKNIGIKKYDFWGIAGKESREQGTENSLKEEKKKKNTESWAGFTKFKTGFAPEAPMTSYIGTYEKVYKPVKLGLYRLLRKVFK